MSKITKNINEKLSQHYGIKSLGLDMQVKDVDLTSRTVKFIANTYYWLDEDLDILISGASKKSIADRGPNSNAGAKIKHLADHIASSDKMVGKPVLISETKIDGKKVLYFESKIPQTTRGDDDLIKYQEEIYDNHSIGFRYKDLAFAEKDSNDEDRRKRYDEFYPQIINKEKADKYGYFWVVKEIELFEASVVAFGSNSLTPYLGSKSATKETVIFEINKRLNILNNQLRKGTVTDDSMKDFELQIMVLKQMVQDSLNSEPSKKDTGIIQPSLSDIQKIEEQQKKNQSNQINYLLNLMK